MDYNIRTSEIGHILVLRRIHKTPCQVLALFMHPSRVFCGLLSVPGLVKPGDKRVDVLELDDARADISATRDNDDSATGPSFMEIMFSVQEDRIVMSLFDEQEYSDNYGKHLQGTLLDTITDALYWICGDFRSSESFIKDGEVSVPVSKLLPLV